MKKKMTRAYIFNNNGTRILRAVLRAVLSGPKVTPIRVRVSCDKHNHMLVAENSMQVLSSFNIPLIKTLLVSNIERNVDDLKFIFTFNMVFSQ